MTNALAVFPDEQDTDRVQVSRTYVAESAITPLVAALERITANARLSLAGKPVRDWPETFGEVEHVLADFQSSNQGGGQ